MKKKILLGALGVFLIATGLLGGVPASFRSGDPLEFALAMLIAWMGYGCLNLATDGRLLVSRLLRARRGAPEATFDPANHKPFGQRVREARARRASAP